MDGLKKIKIIDLENYKKVVENFKYGVVELDYYLKKKHMMICQR